MAEFERLAWFARLSRRRRHADAMLRALSAGVLLAAPIRLVTGSNAIAIAAGALCAALFWHRFLPSAQSVDARAIARHFDERFPELEDSTELLLADCSAGRRTLQPLQRSFVEQKFQQLDSEGKLRAALPPLPVARVAAWLLPAVIVAAASGALRYHEETLLPATTRATAVVDATVWLAPQDYTGVNASRVNKLDFETLADASVRWSLRLSPAVDRVSLVFHNGDELALTTANGRTWQSPDWAAFSTVYRIVADGVELPDNIHRVTVTADKPPEVTVSAPVQALAMVDAQSDKPVLRLTLDARDDYGLSAANARITLARGTGEQVRFREKSLPLKAEFEANGKRMSVDQTLDLVALGMERGDEFFLYAQIADNRPGKPNVTNSATFIVRWPSDDVAGISQVAAVSVNVLPEYFRSQRQLIIDTESLMADRGQLDGDEFRQRSQSLASDQKMLRLRYGQFLGEEAETAIGQVAQIHDSVDRDQSPGADEHDDDHAGQERTEPVATGSGAVAAAIAPWAHLHDTSEHATLFDPTTRGLLKSALGEMWQAELKLRLAEPDAALPYEYRALELIKRVQRSSRIYLRRAGFQPTPVDETRRLTGELDGMARLQAVPGAANEPDSSRLRRLFEALNRAEPAPPGIVLSTAPLIKKLASVDSDWLDALRAVDALQAKPDCEDCATALSSALWRKLGPQHAAPGSGKPQASPLTQAFEARARLAPTR